MFSGMCGVFFFFILLNLFSTVMIEVLNSWVKIFSFFCVDAKTSFQHRIAQHFILIRKRGSASC